MSSRVSMQWITCPFCNDRQEINWIDLPDSLPECCSRAGLRKKIHQRKFDDEAMHPKYYVEVTEFMLDTNDIVHRDGLPLYRSMVDDCKIDWITGYVNTEVYRDHWISGVIHNMYQDVTTMVEGYDDTYDCNGTAPFRCSFRPWISKISR